MCLYVCDELFCVVNVGEDCPVFDGLYEFCQLSTGGSIGIITPPFVHCVYARIRARIVRKNSNAIS